MEGSSIDLTSHSDGEEDENVYDDDEGEIDLELVMEIHDTNKQLIEENTMLKRENSELKQQIQKVILLLVM